MSPQSRRLGPGDRVRQAQADAQQAANDAQVNPPIQDARFAVELPGGGELILASADEVQMWNETRDRYIADYRLTKTNDRVLLGAILTQILSLYRAQKLLASDDAKKAASAQAAVTAASEEIRKGEKALGLDKATREKGGQATVADYVMRLKRAAYEKGVRISDRVLEYERIFNELSWKIRLLRNGDDEDKQYHRLTPDSIIDWLEQELGKIHEAEKKWAKEKGSVFIGKL